MNKKDERMLYTKNLTKTYKAKNGSVTKALKDVSLNFGNRGLIFLLGKSGSGKSTLLNLLGGIDKATGGEVVVNGRSSATFTDSDFDSYRNTYVGFVFQEYNLIDTYTVGANVALALELQGKAVNKENIQRLLRKVDLVDEKGETLFNRQVSELSGGQKQRVAIARALIKDPQIILADEPTGALDGETGERLYDLLKNLAQEKPVIVVTHDRENAEKYGDRIIELQDGKIISDSAPIMLSPPAQAAAALTQAPTALTQAPTALTQAATNTNNTNSTTNLIHTTISTSPIQGKLPIKRCLTMALSGLKTKKIRLVLSVLISVIAFAVFGLCITALSIDVYSAELKTLYANKQQMVTVLSDNSSTYYFSPAQLDELKKYNHGKLPMLMANPHNDVSLRDYLPDEKLNKKNTPYEWLAAASFAGFVELDPLTGAADANLIPDSRFVNKSLCKLPQSFTEIALTDLRADVFMRFGYKAEDGTVHKITTPDDLIGKTIGGFTVCGIFSTELSRESLAKGDVANYDLQADVYLNSLYSGVRQSLPTYAYVCKDFFSNEEGRLEELKPYAVLLKLSGNFTKDRAMLTKLQFSADAQTYSVFLNTPFSIFANAASFFQGFVAVFTLVLAIAFSVFSALLTMNFLTVSLDFKQKELGILRALGARRKDVLRICLLESLLIACINFVLSLSVVLIFCAAFNAHFFTGILNVGFLHIGAMFLLCFGVSALATVIPLWRTVQKKPIDIINQK